MSETKEQRICEATGKICYTEKEAGIVMHYFKRKRNLLFKRKFVPQRSYFCNDCGAYHLTHFKKKKKKLR